MRVFKDKYCGWVVEETIRLNETLELKVSTKKLNGYVQTTGMVSKINGAFRTFALYQDFYKSYNKIEAKRVTEKTVKDHHGFVSIDTIITDAKSHYSI